MTRSARNRGLSLVAEPRESRLVWLVDPGELPYVRVSRAARAWLSRSRCPTNRARSRREGRIVVGWAETHLSTRDRRYFWLKSYDRANDLRGIYARSCPMEAVDPMTLAPNEPGERNERAYGDRLTKAEMP